MKAKIVYYKNRFSDYIFARIMVPVAFSRVLIVEGSGKLYKGDVDLRTPRSYILSFIRLTSKFINSTTILNIIEEQLESG